MDDLAKSELLQMAMNSPIQLNENSRRQVSASIFQEETSPLLLNVENGMIPFAGMQETTLKKTLTEKSRMSNWEIKTVRLTSDKKAGDMVSDIQDAKICVMDTTHYQDSKNMYVYFFLGLAHGFQKEVVPIINATMNRDIPFDVLGLWQVYFSGLEGLEAELADILPKARESIENQQRDYLYRQLWGPFMEARRTKQSEKKKSLHVMTCGRNVLDADRGNRTNLDKCDFITVADLSFFVGEKFQYAKVQIEPPKSKKTIAELTRSPGGNRADDEVVKQLREDMLDDFNNPNLKGNWIIVGAPDSSDYSEVVLAQAHGIPPYSPKKHITERIPFVFVKKRSTDNPMNVSSFYQCPSDDKEMIRWGDKVYECILLKEGDERKGTTYGVITVLNKPVFATEEVEDQKKFIILSGFTGIATYAMIEILTGEAYKNEYMCLLKKYNNLHAQEKNVNILVGASYWYKEFKPAMKRPGDTRELKTLEFKDIQEITVV
jgi:hypothetical protein